MNEKSPSSANQDEWRIRFCNEHVTTEATIISVGAAVRELTVNKNALLEGFSAGQRPPAAANSVLAPWPNRVRDAAFEFRGYTYQLEISEPERGTAIHGFTQDMAFTCVRHTSDNLVLQAVLGPEPGWPWLIELSISYTVGETGLHAIAKVKNLASTDAPFAFGVHTYLSAGGDSIDETELETVVDKYVEADERLCPTAVRDIRPRTIGALKDTVLDDGFHTSSHTHTLSSGSCASVLRVDPSMNWLQVYTLREKAKNSEFPASGDAVAVEPMTAPADALNSGIDLIVLKPNEEKQFKWSIETK